jgi:LacI family transcriptional regulator
MKDVAARAGVGFKTVSRVVNDEPGVSEETAQKVRRAASELHYRRDAIAGNLRRATGRTDTLGLLVASVGNEFDAAINRTVEDVARRRGVAVFSASTDEEPERERQHARGLLARRVDGLLMMPSSGDLSFLAPELEMDTPVVAVDRPASGIVVDTVMADNVGGARDAVAHLIDHGHRRIAVLAHLETLTTASQRIAGAREAWDRAGLAAEDLQVVSGLSSDAEIVAAVLSLMDSPQPPSAVFSARNKITTAAVRALQLRGLQHEIALMGFDDFGHADLLDPAVSVVAQDPAQLGARATARLFARLEDPALPVEETVLPTRLVPRRSCGCGRKARVPTA